MRLNKIILNTLLLFLCIESVNALSIRRAGWHWSDFALHEGIGLSKAITTTSLVADLNQCLQVLDYDIACDGASYKLIILSRIDSEHDNTVLISNGLLTSIPNDFENELYYLREYAARALARRGQPDKLFEELEEFNQDPDFDDYLLLAAAGNFSGKSEILTDLQSDDPMLFCQTTLFIKPFLALSYSDRNEFITLLINALNSENDFKASCAIFQLFNQSNSTGFLQQVEPIIVSLASSDDEKLRQRAGLLVTKWALSLNKEMPVISQLVETAVTASSSVSNSLMSYLIDTGFLAKPFIYEDSQQDLGGSGSVIGQSETEEFHSYLAEHPFDAEWINYANQLKFTDYQDLLIEFNANLNQVVDIDNKLNYFLPVIQQFNNTELTLKLADLFELRLPGSLNLLLDPLFSQSNGLQKNSMMARYINYYKNQKVLLNRGVNDWLRMVDLNNIMNICQIEVLPIRIDISNPNVLKKYNEEAIELLKDCSRL